VSGYAVRRLAVILAIVGMLLARCASAATLATQLDDLLRNKGLLQVGIQPVDTVVPVLIRSVARAADFPTAATGPDFAYEIGPGALGFERSPQPLNPVLVETAQTVGRNVLQIGGALLWSEFNRLNGGLLENTRSDFTVAGETPEQGPTAFPGALTFDDFTIQNTVLSGFLTYGITDRWDVGLVVPIVYTVLDASGARHVRIDDQNVLLDRFEIDDDKLGVGDLLARTKYVYRPIPGLNVASTLALRIPSGNPDDFQGTGQTTVTPGIIATHIRDRVAFSASAGMDITPDDLELSAIRYGAAMSVRLLTYASLVTEITGRSTVTDDTFRIDGTRFVTRKDGTIALVDFVTGTLPRADVVSGSVGFKGRILPGVVGFVSLIFPLTKDGVTAPLTPIGGIEIPF
jgi:hypothetical protein